jgi:hypothetical protein
MIISRIVMRDGGASSIIGSIDSDFLGGGWLHLYTIRKGNIYSWNFWAQRNLYIAA